MEQISIGSEGAMDYSSERTLVGRNPNEVFSDTDRLSLLSNIERELLAIESKGGVSILDREAIGRAIAIAITLLGISTIPDKNTEVPIIIGALQKYFPNLSAAQFTHAFELCAFNKLPSKDGGDIRTHYNKFHPLYATTVIEAYLDLLESAKRHYDEDRYFALKRMKEREKQQAIAETLKRIDDMKKQAKAKQIK